MTNIATATQATAVSKTSSSKLGAKRKARRRATAKSALAEPAIAASGEKTSKRDQLAALLVRDEGATIEQMTAAMGWLPHTVRAALTGLKKKGFAIDSDKVDGLRTYRAVVPQ